MPNRCPKAKLVLNNVTIKLDKTDIERISRREIPIHENKITNLIRKEFREKRHTKRDKASLKQLQARRAVKSTRKPASRRAFKSLRKASR